MSQTTLETIDRHHKRFIALSDHFKSLWTFHQMLQAIYKHIIKENLPYTLDFKTLYETIKGLPGRFHMDDEKTIWRRMDKIEKDLENYQNSLSQADKRVSASHIRQFFEKRNAEENQERILFHIIKFYLYGGVIDDEIRDKLDFLITHLATEFSDVHEQFRLREPEYLAKVFKTLMQVGRFPDVDESLREEYLVLLNELMQEVSACQSIEDFVLSGVLKAIRNLKARMGPAMLHPKVLLKVAELNVITKNQYMKVYEEEEEQLLESTHRVKQLVDSHPGPTHEMISDLRKLERMRERLFNKEKGRDVKLEHLAEYKRQLQHVVEKLENDFSLVSPQSSSPAEEALPSPAITSDALLLKELHALGSKKHEKTGFQLEDFELKALKAYELLKNMEQLEERDRIFLKSALLRYRVDRMVQKLLELREKGLPLSKELRQEAENILWEGQELEKQLQWITDESLFRGTQEELHLSNRARYRLMRSLSGFWLLYDQLAKPT